MVRAKTLVPYNKGTMGQVRTQLPAPPQPRFSPLSSETPNYHLEISVVALPMMTHRRILRHALPLCNCDAALGCIAKLQKEYRVMACNLIVM